MKLVIRDAEKTDFDSLLGLMQQLQEIHSNARKDLFIQTDRPLEKEYYQELLNKDNHYIYVVEDTNTKDVIAYTSLRIETFTGSLIMKDRKTLFVNELTVNEKYRGQGIGKYLFEFVMNKGREFEVQSIDLTVAEFNQSAIEFYKNIGMKTRSRRMEYIIS